jgi:hypothetical protein
MLEPDETLIEFASKLPETIRTTALVRCLIAFKKLEMRSDQDLLAAFRAILSGGDATRRAYRVAAMAGVMTLALENEDGEMEALFDKLYKEHGTTLFLESALRAPLQDRHWQATRKAFAKLLRGPLSGRALYTWHRLLTAKEGIPRFSS